MNNNSMLKSVKHCKLKILGVTLLLFATQTGIVSAQELNPSPTPKPVEYTLPYPGLLPDHPLYFLRAMRDTMQMLLVSNPAEKAELYLLQADKEVSASVHLAEKQETRQLAVEAAISSQDYFEKGLEEVADAKKQGLAIHDIVKKMVLANQKHQETLTLLQKEKENTTAELGKALGKAQQLEKKAKSFLSSK